jgi:hypothetical protein
MKTTKASYLPTPSTTEPSSPEPSLVASPAAHAELVWFFNRAEIEVDTPSRCAYLFGCGPSPVSLAAVERRAEAVHAAGKIHRWMQALPAGYPKILAGLYTQWPCPPPLRRALGRVAGAVLQSPEVQMRYAHERSTSRTRARTAALWLLERVESEGAAAFGAWRQSAERQCALALRSYEHVRGPGECAVPEELLAPEDP